MDKNEILDKASKRKANQLDEMEMQIEQKGNGMATLGVLVFVLILMTVKMLKNQTWFDVYSLLFVSMAIPKLYKGIKLKRTQDATVGAAFSFLAIVFLMIAIFDILK